jgi:ABC-type multidrug transport system ATPase subunit
MNILMASINPTDGDAIFNGYSVVNNPDAIRAQLGVCPQFDILWPHLTARQHIIIMGAIKTN